MIGLDVTHKAAIGQEEVRRLLTLGRVGEVAAELVTFFTGTYEKVFGFRAPPIHDAVAVAAVVEPGILETRPMRVEVECESELTRGETVCDFYGVWGKPPNAEVGVDLDRAVFFEILYRSLKELV
jgi:inosine-uridine nucleoside N-ribohydrolase